MLVGYTLYTTFTAYELSPILKHLILLLGLFFLCKNYFAQTDSLNGNALNSTVTKSAIDLPLKVLHDSRIYTYSPYYECSTPQLDRLVQLDSSGSKERITVKVCKGNDETHTAYIDMSSKFKYRVLEIWNVDTKTLLFQIEDRYKRKFRGIDRSQHPFKQNRTCKSRYRLVIDKDGSIEVINRFRSPNCHFVPLEGKYQLVNGMYQMADTLQ